MRTYQRRFSAAKWHWESGRRRFALHLVRDGIRHWLSFRIRRVGCYFKGCDWNTFVEWTTRFEFCSRCHDRR